MKTVSKDRFNEAREENEGWCTECQSFVNACVEPDATEYECEVCGNMSVMGAEEAVLEGEIEVLFEDGR